MQLTTLLALPLASLAVAQQTISVDVGKTGLNFNPNNIQAAPGTKVQFHYYPKNHSVIQSSFQQPCMPLAGGMGINSGFVPVSSGASPSVFTVTVNDTSPVWIYCAQTEGNHCQAGMSMVINQPTGPNSLAAYQANSKNATTSTIASIQGGVFSTSSSNSTSSSGGSSTSSGYGSGSSPGSTPGSTPGSSSGSGKGSNGSNGAAVEVVSWGLLGAGVAVAGFFM